MTYRRLPNLLTGPARTSPVILRRLVNHAERYGLNLDGAFGNLGFTAADLQSPNFFLESGACMEAVRRALSLFRRPTLGLELGSVATLSSWGIASLVFLLAPSSREFLELIVRTQYSTGRLVALRLEITDGDYCVLADPLCDDRSLASFLLDETFATLTQLGRLIVGPQFIPGRLELMSERPLHGAFYEDTFRCPVQFRRMQNCLRYPQTAYQVATGDAALLSHWMREAPFMAKGDHHSTSQLEAGVVQTIRRNLRRGAPIEEAARSMYLTERTLRRRLSGLGLGYAEMVAKERQACALRLLAHSTSSMREVAKECGFADERSFSRAIKRWTGMSPLQLRRNFAAEEDR